MNPEHPEPMVHIDDFVAAIEGLCPECCVKVKRALILRLASKSAPPKLHTDGYIEHLLEGIAADHAVSVEAMRARSNEAHMVAARRDFAKQARERGYSLPMIGNAIARHHSSVMNLLKETKARK